MVRDRQIYPFETHLKIAIFSKMAPGRAQIPDLRSWGFSGGFTDGAFITLMPVMSGS